MCVYERAETSSTLPSDDLTLRNTRNWNQKQWNWFLFPFDLSNEIWMNHSVSEIFESIIKNFFHLEKNANMNSDEMPSEFLQQMFSADPIKNPSKTIIRENPNRYWRCGEFRGSLCLYNGMALRALAAVKIKHQFSWARFVVVNLSTNKVLLCDTRSKPLM